MSDLGENLRTAWVVASATVATGVSTLLEKIPDDIGKLATLVGIVLSAVLIYVHISRELRDRRKADVELQLLRRQLDSQD